MGYEFEIVCAAALLAGYAFSPNTINSEGSVGVWFFMLCVFILFGFVAGHPWLGLLYLAGYFVGTLVHNSLTTHDDPSN